MITYRKLKTEQIILQVYFPFNIEAGTVTVSVEVSSGTDANPDNICLGPQNLQNNRADILFDGGIPGVVYKVYVTLSILGDTYVEAFYIAIGNDWTDYLPGEFVPIPPTVVLPELYGELFLRSGLYPIDTVPETESAILAVNSIDVETIVTLGFGQPDTESAMMTLNSIEVYLSTIEGEFTDTEKALMALNSIKVKSAIMGDTTETEKALMVLNSITVKTEPNGSTEQTESAMLELKGITVVTV